jgi:transcriptional regulator with XRE-family HTH domain
MLGISQAKLAEGMGISFQQIQSYESGRARISASRLLGFAQALTVPVTFFYDDVDPVRAAPVVPQSETSEGDVLREPEVMTLVAAYYAIPDLQVRRCLFDLAKALCRERE